MKTSSFILIISLFSFISCNQNQEKAFDEIKELAAINEAINQETKSFFDGNYDGWKKHWSHENYAMQAWNNDDGTFDAAIGWEKIDKQGKEWIEKYYKSGKRIVHPVVKKEKPIVKFFNENVAYLIWKQYNANKDNTFYIISQETRLMEKQNGEWRIVNVNALWNAKLKIPIDSLKI